MLGADIRRDERGVIYTEQLLMVVIGLCIAGCLVSAGTLLFQPRALRIADVLYSNVP